MPKDSSEPVWWLAYFDEHPDKSNPDRNIRKNAYFGEGNGIKLKVYCRNCFVAHTKQRLEEEAAKVRLDATHVPLTEPEVNAWLWTQKRENTKHRVVSAYGAIRKVTSTLLTHLEGCEYATPAVKAAAADEKRLDAAQGIPDSRQAGPSTRHRAYNSGSAVRSPQPTYPRVGLHTGLDPVQTMAPFPQPDFYPGYSSSSAPASPFVLGPSDSISNPGVPSTSAHSRPLSRASMTKFATIQLAIRG